MIQRYTLEEIHRYQEDLAAAESRIVLGSLPDKDTYDHYKVQVHVMREFLLHMHENLLKHGPIRPSLLARWLTTREIRKIWARTTDEPPKISDLELQRISEEISRKARRADEAAAAVMGRPRK